MTKPTVEEINNFHVLLKGFIDNSSSVENALEIIKGIYNQDTLGALLEEYYQDEAIFQPLTEKYELRNLLIYFCEINSNVIKMPFKSGHSANRFCILQMVIQDKKKYTELYDWIQANKSELLETENKDKNHLLEYQKTLLIQQNPNPMESYPPLIPHTTISPNAPVKKIPTEEQLDEDIKPLINTRFLVDNSLLTAFLYQSYKHKLAGRRIALMPMIRSTEAISSEQLQAIKASTPLTYTTGVTIEGDNIVPVLGDHLTAPHMSFAVWPVCVPNAHYGLFILDIRPNRDPQAIRGFYIEPLNCEWMIQLMRTTYADQLPVPCDLVLLPQMLSSFMYEKNVKQLTINLDIHAENIEYIFLAQDPRTNLCSDNVIAALDCLASDNIDLLNSPMTINSLQNQYISEAMAQAIRLQQVKMFGMDYLWLQLPKELQNAETRRCIEELKQTQNTLFPKKATAVPSSEIQSSSIDIIDKNPEPTLQHSASWYSMFPAAEKTMDTGLSTIAVKNTASPEINP